MKINVAIISISNVLVFIKNIIRYKMSLIISITTKLQTIHL